MTNIILNPTRPTIISDVDDVLLNWLDGFRVFCEDRLEHPISASGPASWDMSGWIGTTPEAVTELIDRFNAGEGGFFARLPAFEDAVEALKHLSDEGYRIHIVTSCSSRPETIAQRTENLHTIFGEIFASIECLDLGISKAPSLARLPRGLWIEDNHTNGLAGADLGHRTYMIRRSHNRGKEAGCDRSDLTWVDHWHDILDHSGLKARAPRA